LCVESTTLMKRTLSRFLVEQGFERKPVLKSPVVKNPETDELKRTFFWS
jgi:hypothetical protein